jgi:hypothetical protein
MRNVSPFARVALGVLLATGSASVAGADIRLIESSLHASAQARVDPHTVDQTNAVDDVPDPGTLRDMSADAAAADSATLSESVAAAGSVTLTGADAFTVHVVESRSGADTGVNGPGGEYSALVTFQVSFLALTDGVVTVDYGFLFSRPDTGLLTPFVITLDSNVRDSRDVRLSFDNFHDLSGTGSSFEQFSVEAQNGYTLTISALISGATSNLTVRESWDATFDVQLPPIAIVSGTSPSSTTSSTSATSSTSTSTISTVAAIVSTTTTLPNTCADLAPAACTSPSLPRLIARRLKGGCSLFGRAESLNPARARRLHRRAARKLSATCRAVSRALEKGKISVECANGVRGTLREFCG